MDSLIWVEQRVVVVFPEILARLKLPLRLKSNPNIQIDFGAVSSSVAMFIYTI